MVRKYLCICLSVVMILACLGSVAAVKQIAVVEAFETVVYNAPSRNGNKIGTLSKGEELTVLDWDSSGFCMINFGKDHGYIVVSDLRISATIESFDEPIKGRVLADDVNLRAKPDITSSIISTFKKGASIEIVEKYNNWYKVTYNRSFGYINAVFVDAPGDANSSGTQVLKMGVCGKEVTKLQQALKDLGYYKGEVNGSFGALTRDALKRFQEDNNIKPDGIAGTETLRALYKAD